MVSQTPVPITTTPKGMVSALGAYFIWSCFPFYFKLLSEYHAVEVIVHRVLWTFVTLLIFLLLFRRWQFIDIIKKNPKWLIITFASGLLIASNWLTYVWAVHHDKILDASLGYFTGPLIGMLLSFFVLKESFRRLQVIAIFLALSAVLVQIVWLGTFPVVALVLAVSFSVYGLLQRQTPLDAASGLFVETIGLLPLCLGWLLTHDVASANVSFWLSPQIFLLMLAGPVTLVPLLLYNQSTKCVNFNTLSFMQYITPLSVFMIAIFYYQETFTKGTLAVFVLIWIALIIYMIDLLKARKVKKI